MQHSDPQPSPHEERGTIHEAHPNSALIAGGGLAGLAAAVMLDELGYKVTLIERKSILGGRTYSFTDKKTGKTIDNGQHLMIGAYHETIKLLERVGAKHKIKYQIPTIVPLLDSKFKRNVFCLRLLPAPLNLALAILFFGGMSIKEKFGLIGLSRELKKINTGKSDPPLNLTVSKWLQKHAQGEKAINSFWEPFTMATLNNSVEAASANSLVQVLINSFFAQKRDGFLIFPKEGLSNVFANPIRKYLELRGHKIITDLGLKEIRILDNKVQAFHLADNTELKASLYISALPPRALLNALPRTIVDTDESFKNLEQLTGSPIVSLNLFFDRPVMTDFFIGSSSTTVHWFFNKSDEGRSTRNEERSTRHVVGTISGAYDFLDKSKEEIVALAMKDLERIYPKVKEAKLTHSLVNIERDATINCSPEIDEIRPRQKVLENFSIVGDWTQTNLPPTIESAVLSSKIAMNSL